MMIGLASNSTPNKPLNAHLYLPLPSPSFSLFDVLAQLSLRGPIRNAIYYFQMFDFAHILYFS